MERTWIRINDPASRERMTQVFDTLAAWETGFRSTANKLTPNG